MHPSIVPLNFPDKSSVSDIEALKVKLNSHTDDIIDFIETGQLEDFFHSIADMIKSMKDSNIPVKEILKSVADITGTPLKKTYDTQEIRRETAKLSINETFTYMVKSQDKLKDILLSNSRFLKFQEYEGNLDEKLIITSSKTIIDENKKTKFNLTELIIDIPSDEKVIFQNIIFRKISKNDPVLKVLKGNIFFENVVFDGVRLEIQDNSKVNISDSRFSNTGNSIFAKDKSSLSLQNVSFDKIGEKTILLADFAELQNPCAILEQYPVIISGLTGSHTTGIQLLKEKKIDFSTLISKLKNIKLSGNHIIEKSIIINGENFSIFGEEDLTLKSNVHQAFIIKNKGSLKCKNVNFECITQKHPPREGSHEMDDSEKETEEKELGFIHVKNGNMEMAESKILYGEIGLYVEDHSIVDLKHCNIINSRKTGIDLKASKVKITDCNIEGNGKMGKDYPQIGAENYSELDIRYTNISNSSDSDGIYVSESRASINKCTINNNNNGIDIRDNSEVKVIDSEIKGNREEGVYIYSNSRATIKKSKIINNKSNGFDVRDKSDVEILDCKINGNIRGIDVKSSKIKLTDSEVNGNVKGIYLELNSSGEIQNCNITKSKMNGFFIESSKIKISDCKINFNGEKGENNFQIFIGKKSKVDIINTDITDAMDKGNNIFSEFESSKLLLDDCTLDSEVLYAHKKDGCFVTTATCLSLGKSDDCNELNIFRDYRDNWLKNQPDGEELIREYYSFAPKIIENINNLPEHSNIYKDIWKNHLAPCLCLIKTGEFNKAKVLYVKMVEILKSLYRQ